MTDGIDTGETMSAETLYEVRADPVLKIEPYAAGSDPVAVCHADKAVVARGYVFRREGTTLIYEVCSGPLEALR